jgi:hypothetical protein
MRVARWLILSLVLAGAAVVALELTGTLQSDGSLDSHALPTRVFGFRPKAMHAIYLERQGITLKAGAEDSTQNSSSVVAETHRVSVTTPGFAGKDAVWRSFVDCVRAKYAAFDVDVVEQRPSEPGYILVAVGGTPSLLGLPATTMGVAPFDGNPVEDPIVFVFSRAARENIGVMCDTAAMETAHTYGLDHEYLCNDPMTYLPPCGPRAFQNVDAHCGERTRRNCASGQPMQNSFQRLLAVLGPHRGIEGPHASTDHRSGGETSTPAPAPSPKAR